jgi:CheY-like chemotaxis protein
VHKQRPDGVMTEPAARSILVVEDDLDIGSILQLIFEGEGYQVRWAPRGSEALRLLATDPPDLITLDLNLPDVTGEEILKHLAQHPDLGRIPVVVLSAYTKRLRPTQQVFRVMEKPFNLDDLVATAEMALGQPAVGSTA